MRPTREVARNRATNPSFEAGSGTVEVRRNRVSNPSFETTINITGAANVTRTLTTDAADVVRGSSALRMVAIANSANTYVGQYAACTPGETILHAANVRYVSGASRYARMTLLWRDANGSAVGTASHSPISLISGDANGTRLSVTAVAPAGATTAYSLVYFYASTGGTLPTAGDTWTTDAWITVGSPTPGAELLENYFDGSSAPAGDFTYAWTGTPHESPSIQRGTGVAGWNVIRAVAYQTKNKIGAGQHSAVLITTAVGAASYLIPGYTPVAPGETVTAHAKVQADHLAYVVIQIRDSSGAVVVNDSGPTGKTGRVSHTVTVPPGGVESRMVIYHRDTGSILAPPIGSRLVVDEVMFVRGKYDGPYFDGDTVLAELDHFTWDGAPHASTSLWTQEIPVTLTAEPSTSPPCPSVQVTVQGLLPGDHRISVWRTADGERAPVRGARNITVVDSFFVDDFEAPLNRNVTYELEILSGPDSGTPDVTDNATLESECGYIQDPMNPATAVPVWGHHGPGGQPVLRPDAFSRIAYKADASRFQVMGSPRPVSISSGRNAPAGIPLVWRTRAEAENVRLRELVQEAPHLVIRPLPEWGSRIPATATYLAESVEESKVIRGHTGNAWTQWETTGDVVRSSSARVVIALWTYQDVAQLFTTYAQKQVSATGQTYLEDQKNPPNV